MNLRELIGAYCQARANVRVAARVGAAPLVMTELRRKADALGTELNFRLRTIERYVGDGLTDADSRNAAMSALDGRDR